MLDIRNEMIKIFDTLFIYFIIRDKTENEYDFAGNTDLKS